MHTATYWIEKLGLQKHPEGGYYKEVYRSEGTIAAAALPPFYEGDRHYATSIYFLLTGDNFSAYHKIQSDETWHFYRGDSLTIRMLSDRGLETAVLGPDIERGEVLQYTVPRDVWFAAHVNDPSDFTLIGCTVAPGFDFRDFKLGTKKELIAQFPQYSSEIAKFAAI